MLQNFVISASNFAYKVIIILMVYKNTQIKNVCVLLYDRLYLFGVSLDGHCCIYHTQWHTPTHENTRKDSPARGIDLSQHSREANINELGWNGTRNTSKTYTLDRAATGIGTYLCLAYL
jgi:hypothetical protein